jgi:flagellar biogenesis protein FliO
MQVKERLLWDAITFAACTGGQPLFVVGVTAQSMQLLGAVEEEELTPIVQAEQDKQAFPSFGDWLTKAKRQDDAGGPPE